MSTQEQQARDRERAWALLGTVEGHPKVQAWLDEAQALQGDRQPLRSFNKRNGFKQWHWAAAAGIVLALGVGAAGYFRVSAPHYETRLGEQRDVILADGSRVTLNTDTALTVRYSSQRRFIELERGEALFVVKHGATQPFDVAAGGTLTRALGTEFNVDMRSSKVTVSVLEGAVRVTADDVAAGPGTALEKGQSIEVRPKERRTLEATADLKRIDAWRARRLEFDDTPLVEAVAEFNRYSKTQVTLGTPELASVRVSGRFRIGDADGFLYSLREALGVDTHETANEVILMRTSKDQSSVR